MENTDKVKNNSKAILIGSLVLVMAFIIIGISGSFAYYTNKIEQRNPDNNSLTVNSGGLVMNFKTLNDKMINANATSLISDADILKASDNYTEFSIEFPTEGNGATVGDYYIYLTGLKMTDNYINSDVKWALCGASATSLSDCIEGNFGSATKKTGGTSTTETLTLSSGSTAEITLHEMNDITIKPVSDINRGTTVSYKLYVWLSSNPSKDQNNLLKGKLTGRVAFKGTTK